jgi:hypothetical protein
LPPNTPGASFFKIGGTANTGEAVPYEFNAGSISLEVENVGPGSRYSSALRFKTLKDSFPDGAPADAMTIRGNGDVIIGNWQDYQNRRLVIRGPNAPANYDSRQDISFQFASAGEALIRSYRGGSWDTYLEFWTSDYNAGPNNHQRRMLVDSSGVSVFGTARMTVCQITSDRAAKQDFAPVNGRDVLAKLAALPITTWAYTNAPSVRHLGPVAQDFAAAFGLGDGDKHIATVDADGVALAAIQGLNHKLEEQLRAKDAEIASLENRLAELERLVTTLAGRAGQEEKATTNSHE